MASSFLSPASDGLDSGFDIFFLHTYFRCPGGGRFHQCLKFRDVRHGNRFPICNDYGISAGTLTVASALVKREAIAPEGEDAAPVVVGEYRSEFINEDKIRAFVEHCYVSMFGREGDAEGVANYTALILDGKKSPKRVAYEFVFSPEFQEKLPGNEEFIRILYRLYFDRVPGAEELSVWVQMLEGGASLEEIVDGFAGSDEFKAIVNEMKNFALTL